MFAVGVQVVDAVMAHALHQDACRDHALVAWVVSYDDPAFPEQYVAQLATTSALPYAVVGDTLAEVREQLPRGLRRSERQPGDPPGVLEVWLSQ